MAFSLIQAVLIAFGIVGLKDGFLVAADDRLNHVSDSRSDDANTYSLIRQDDDENMSSERSDVDGNIGTTSDDKPDYNNKGGRLRDLTRSLYLVSVIKKPQVGNYGYGDRHRLPRQRLIQPRDQHRYRHRQPVDHYSQEFNFGPRSPPFVDYGKDQYRSPPYVDPEFSRKDRLVDHYKQQVYYGPRSPRYVDYSNDQYRSPPYVDPEFSRHDNRLGAQLETFLRDNNYDYNGYYSYISRLPEQQNRIGGDEIHDKPYHNRVGKDIFVPYIPHRRNV